MRRGGWSVLLILAAAGLTGCGSYRRRCVTTGFPLNYTYTFRNGGNRVYEAVGISVIKPKNIPVGPVTKRLVDAPHLALPVDVYPGEIRIMEVSFMVGQEGEPLPEGDFSVGFQVQAYPMLRGRQFSGTMRFVVKPSCPGG